MIRRTCLADTLPLTIMFSASSPAITINVLQNDWLCGDSSNIKLEIYRPDNSFPPHSGTASVVANHIVYQGSSNVLSDSIIYKVSNIADNSLVGFAMVHININGNCTPTAFEDYFDHDNLEQGARYGGSLCVEKRLFLW